MKSGRFWSILVDFGRSLEVTKRSEDSYLFTSYLLTPYFVMQIHVNLGSEITVGGPSVKNLNKKWKI